MKIANNQKGFTLIEAMVALSILTIGILTLYTMQTTALKGNATANGLTTASTWATNRIEQILSMKYDDIVDTDGDGTGKDSDFDGVDDSVNDFGLNDSVCCQNGNDPSGVAVAGCVKKADYCFDENGYWVYVNVASLVAPVPGSTEPYVKSIRVITVRKDFGLRKQVVMNYYKQKTF